MDIIYSSDNNSPQNNGINNVNMTKEVLNTNSSTYTIGIVVLNQIKIYHFQTYHYEAIQ